MKPTRARRDEREHAVQHADPGAEDRDDGDLLPGDPRHRHPLERRGDLDLLDREVLGHLVGEEHRDLVDELAEELRRSLLVAEQPELVLHQRMVDDGDALRR